MGLSPEFLKRYEFDWEVLDVIIGGKSAIDSGTHLLIRSTEEALRYMDCYGYDIDNPIEKAELFGNFQEALSFIRRYFLQPDNPDGLKIEIPRKIAELSDMAQLLTYASTPQAGGASGQALNTLWACAVIKIMHTIAHIDKDLRSNYIADVQTQILDRFYKFIVNDESGQLFLGRDTRDPDRVELVAFETKPKKSRDSVILKLLHKPENVAEDIFDRIGIRFVTKNKFDAIRVVKFLKDRYVLMPANVKPSRSRNTLVDTTQFSKTLSHLMKEVESGALTPGDLQNKIVQLCESDSLGALNPENPHTSRFYSAIQFTCRQLIKIKNPLFDDIRALKAETKGGALPENIAKTVEKLDLRNLQKEIRFFYPFEVQILDEASYRESRAGLSSHSNYKKSQIQAAMRRVLGELMRLAPTGA
ncbi:MAG: TIGR04552 family protein [Bdellovibrionota bacterium]